MSDYWLVQFTVCGGKPTVFGIYVSFFEFQIKHRQNTEEIAKIWCLVRPKHLVGELIMRARKFTTRRLVLSR